MGFEQAQVSGMTFLEVLVALGIACAAAGSALALLAAADYHADKAAIDLAVAAQVRQLQEQLAAMPYAALTATFQGSARTAGLQWSGFLVPQPAPLFPWHCDALVELQNAGTEQESVAISGTLAWQEPGNPSARGTPVSRMLALPPLLRTKL